MQGTNYLNFIGRYCWVAAGEHGLAAVEVTERDEPQAVIGSTLHSLAFPDASASTCEHGRHAGARPRASGPGHQRQTSCIRSQKPEILQVQTRGEYLYAACGEGGLRVFDIAFIDDKALLGAHHHRPGVARSARSSTCRRSTPPPSPPRRRWPPTRRATHAPENQEPTVHPHVRLPLRRRQVRGADPRRRRPR